MTISKKVNEDYTSALKAKDRERVSALRLIKAEFAALEKTTAEPTDSQYISILAKMARTRLDTAETYKTAGRDDLYSKEIHEASVIKTYIPAQLSKDEVMLLVARAADSLSLGFEKANMGKIVKEAVSNAQGRTDGKTVSDAVLHLIALTAQLK